MKNKKYWWSLGLIVLLYMSITGQYLSNEELYESACFYGLIDTLIITIVLTIIPIIFVIINKGKLNEIKGDKVCKWNSIIWFIISTIIAAASEGQIFGIGWLGAIMYYYINKWIFVSNSTSNHIKQNIIRKKIPQLLRQNGGHHA